MSFRSVTSRTLCRSFAAKITEFHLQNATSFFMMAFQFMQVNVCSLGYISSLFRLWKTTNSLDVTNNSRASLVSEL